MAGTAYWIGTDSGNEGDLGTAANFLTDSGTPASPPDGNDALRFDARAGYAVTGGSDFAAVSFVSITLDRYQYAFGSSGAAVEMDASLLVVDTLQHGWIDGTFAMVEVRNTALKEKVFTFTDGDIANLEVLSGGNVYVGAACELSKDAGEFTYVQGGTLTLEANANDVQLLVATAGSRIVTARDIAVLVHDGPITFQGTGKALTTVTIPGGTLYANGSGTHTTVILFPGATVSDADNASQASITNLIYDRTRSRVNLKSKSGSVTNDMPVGLEGGAGGIGA